MGKTVSICIFVILSFLILTIKAQNSSFIPGCHTPNPSIIPFCAGLVKYQISNNYNDSYEDLIADLSSQFHGNRCPYYVNQAFQCRLHFPQCVLSSTNQTILIKYCENSCVTAGQTYDDRLCSSFDQSFSAECDDSDYTSNDANCIPVPSSNDNSGETWKIILVTILCVIGFLLLVSYAWSRYRQYKQKQILEKEDDDDRQRELERAQNIGNQSSIMPPTPQFGSDFNNIQPNNFVQSDSAPYLHPTDPRRSSIGREVKDGGGYPVGPTMVVLPNSK